MLKKIKYIANFILSIFIVIFFIIQKKINKKKVWLFGAGNGQYENNISCFHHYILNNLDKKTNDVYFITTNSSFLSFTPSFPVLIRGSIHTYALSMIADYLIFDTCNSDIAPGVHKFLKGLKVNVNHGFEGLKKLPHNYYANIDATIHCASSEKEKEIKVLQCGAPKENVYVTGYPRFDEINEHPSHRTSKILYFPTWRAWLENKNEAFLENSEYVKSIRDFLSNETLKRYLVSNNITLYYKPHHKVNRLIIDGLSCENIIILEASDNLSKYIRESDMLITDYSSVAWDFLYNDRLVLFYPFDINRYIDEQGLYYDVRNLGAENCKLTAESITDLVVNQCNSNVKKTSKMATEFFKFRDEKNCERLLSVIFEKKS